jgi:hypothetical protein
MRTERYLFPPKVSPGLFPRPYLLPIPCPPSHFSVASFLSYLNLSSFFVGLPGKSRESLQNVGDKGQRILSSHLKLFTNFFSKGIAEFGMGIR